MTWRHGIFLALALSACGPDIPPPTFVTSQGIEVWVYGRPLTLEEVEGAVAATVAEFGDRYSSEDAARVLSHARVSFINADSYELMGGGEVAGNLSLDGGWIYVGAHTRRLDESAFVHELVHYLDVQLNGYTDSTHESWGNRIYPGIERVNSFVREHAQK